MVRDVAVGVEELVVGDDVVLSWLSAFDEGTGPLTFWYPPISHLNISNILVQLIMTQGEKSWLTILKYKHVANEIRC